MNEKNYCVIMAGGAGSRFWPMSRNNRPKQFIDILGTGKTLLQQTYDRFRKLFRAENFLVVTNKAYKELTLEQLPELNENQVLLEPYRRNTAPCIAYANYKIKSICPEANIVVSPADHLIRNEEDFLQVIRTGLDFVANKDVLLTLGIKPTSPQTGYGYIQTEKTGVAGIEKLGKVKTFTEKPDYEMAKVFFESGEFFWNSGIFIWSLKAIITAFEKSLPEVDTLFKSGIGSYNTENEREFITNTYSSCKNISIDYGIMEKAENVYVLCSDFGWSDLGTWGSLFEQCDKDKNNNVIQSENVLTYKTNNSIIKTPNDKLVLVQGLDDYIVVESENVLLICKKEDEQQIRQFVNDVKLKKGEKFI